MKISSSMKAQIAAFLALWFSGQIRDINALAAALEVLASEARKQAGEGVLNR